MPRPKACWGVPLSIVAVGFLAAVGFSLLFAAVIPNAMFAARSVGADYSLGSDLDPDIVAFHGFLVVCCSFM